MAPRRDYRGATPSIHKIYLCTELGLAVQLFYKRLERFVLPPCQAKALFAIAVEDDIKALTVVPQGHLHEVVAFDGYVVVRQG